MRAEAEVAKLLHEIVKRDGRLSLLKAADMIRCNEFIRRIRFMDVVVNRRDRGYWYWIGALVDHFSKRQELKRRRA